jgi:hypothetical protein
VRTLEHLGVQPVFVAAEEVGRGELRRRRCRLLMLPYSLALSRREAGEIRDFVEQGGIVVAAGQPGVFDEHGRRAEKPMLSDVFSSPAAGSTAGAAFGAGRAFYLDPSQAPSDPGRMSQILSLAGVEPRFPIIRADGGDPQDVETYSFAAGPTTILALQRDLPAPPTAIAAPTGPGGREAVIVKLAHPLEVYDLRRRRALGKTDRIALELGPAEPVLLALSKRPLASPSLTGPRRASLGANVEFHIRSGLPGSFDVIHFEVVDPDGNLVAHYSGNLLAPRGAAVAMLPLAVNDKTGRWKIRARDVLTGAVAATELAVGD